MFDDTLIGGEGSDTIIGGQGDDSLRGEGGNDSIDGGIGNDILNGGAGADTIDGGDGIDLLDFSEATNAVEVRLYTNSGALNDAAGDSYFNIENVVSGSGNDKLIGDTAANMLDGGEGNDFFSGREGNDTILGGLGADTMFGDAGTDLIDYSTATGSVEVRLYNTLGSLNEAAGDRFFGIENITTGDFNDKLIGDSVANVLDGGDGDDFFSGREGNDTVLGGACADTVFGDAGTDLIDYSDATGSVEVRLFNTRVSLNEAAGDRLFGIENVTTGDFNDKLIGDAVANVLDGGDGDDFFSGREGNDTIIGGAGDDTIFGEAGADLFVVSAGFESDVIFDFDEAEDRVDVSAFSSISDFDDLVAISSSNGQDLTFDFGAGDILTLINTSINDLSDANFIYSIPA